MILDDLGSRLNIDRERILAAGTSYGGMMAYRVACELKGPPWIFLTRRLLCIREGRRTRSPCCF
jgi:predicted peptidase